MAILLLMLAVVVSVAMFFTLAVKFGNYQNASVDVLDLNTVPLPIKKREVLYREYPEDLIV